MAVGRTRSSARVRSLRPEGRTRSRWIGWIGVAIDRSFVAGDAADRRARRLPYHDGGAVDSLASGESNLMRLGVGGGEGEQPGALRGQGVVVPGGQRGE